MKLTEAEALIKLEHVGLPTYGTYDELIDRLERNGLIEKAEANPKESKQVPQDKDTESEEKVDVRPQKQSRRGRPRGSK